MPRLSFAFLLLACGGAAPSGTAARQEVGVYVSAPRAFDTNSFWIEGPQGLVLIDTQFLPAEALHAVERAEEETGKRVVMAVVLHANPDKFNGARVLEERGIRVVTSEQVRALIPAVAELRHRWFAARYPGEYPDRAPELESFGDRDRTLDVAGTQISLHVMGAGCSEAHVVVEWQGHVFVGDLITNHNHSWLELGHLDEWLARLEEIRALHPRFVHPGRGRSGGPELIDAEQEYLQTVRSIVLESQPHVPFDDAYADALRARIEARYPGYGYAVFLRVGLPAVIRALAGHVD